MYISLAYMHGVYKINEKYKKLRKYSLHKEQFWIRLKGNAEEESISIKINQELKFR